MIRSIDLLFSSIEFLNLLKRLKSYQSIPLNSLFNRSPNSKGVSTSDIFNLSKIINKYQDIPLKVETGRILFLLFLQGKGFIAEKLIGKVDLEFTALFILGVINTEDEDRDVWLPNSMDNFGYYLLNHFNRISQLFMELDQTEKTIATNQFVTLTISNPDRLIDLYILEGYINSLGSNKSLTTEHLIKGYKEFQRIKKALQSPEIDPDNRLFWDVFTCNGILNGLITQLKFEKMDGTILDVSLNVSFFVDLLYGQTNIPRIEDCFQAWILDQKINPLEIKSTVKYPFEVNLNYQRSEQSDEDNIRSNFIAFMVYRFGLFYEVSVQLNQLLRRATDFNTENYAELVEIKGKPILVIFPDDISILPITEAMSEKIEFESELRFRTPIVPWSQRMSFLSHNSKWPAIYLKKIGGITTDSQEIIKNIFLGKIIFTNRSQNKREMVIYYLRTFQEMKERLSYLDSSSIEALESSDFKDYLLSMGYSNEDLPAEAYKGINGLSKTIEIHSLSHLRHGDKDGFLLPLIYRYYLKN